MTHTDHILDIFYTAPVTTQNVVLTGDFDQWEGRKDMQTWKKTDTSTIFISSIPVALPLKPTKCLFKFIVDGKWCCSPHYATETAQGFENNALQYGPGDNAKHLRIASEPPNFACLPAVPLLKDSFLEREEGEEEAEEAPMPSLGDSDTLSSDVDAESAEEAPFERFHDWDSDPGTVEYDHPPPFHVNYHYDPESHYLMHTVGLSPSDTSDPTVPLLRPREPLAEVGPVALVPPKWTGITSAIAQLFSYILAYFLRK